MAPNTNKELNANLNIVDFKLPRWEQLPSMPLYLEQVLSLIDEWLGDYLSVGGKKIMTKTMVNNYVKLDFIDPPINKKYERISVGKLFVIALLKPVFTIEEVSNLIDHAIDFGGNHAAQSYNRFCDTIEQAVNHAFNQTTFEKPHDPADPRNIYWNVCNALASQLYVRYTYLYNVKSSGNIQKTSISADAK